MKATVTWRAINSVTAELALISAHLTARNCNSHTENINL